MKGEDISKTNLIAILSSIREVARHNDEERTVEHINRILEEVRK